MRLSRWRISRSGSRLEVDVGGRAPLSAAELDDLCDALEPQLGETVHEVLLDGEFARSRSEDLDLVRVVRALGRLSLRHGKPFSVRPI